MEAKPNTIDDIYSMFHEYTEAAANLGALNDVQCVRDEAEDPIEIANLREELAKCNVASADLYRALRSRAVWTHSLSQNMKRALQDLFAWRLRLATAASKLAPWLGTGNGLIVAHADGRMTTAASRRTLIELWAGAALAKAVERAMDSVRGVIELQSWRACRAVAAVLTMLGSPHPCAYPVTHTSVRATAG